MSHNLVKSIMNNLNKEIKKYLLFFTLPFFIYFIYVTADLQINNIFNLLTSAVLIFVVSHYFFKRFHYYYFKKLDKDFFKIEELGRKIKSKLLRYPKLELRMTILLWVFLCILTLAFYELSIGLNTKLITAVVSIFIITLPYTTFLNYFIAERILIKMLSLPALRAHKVEFAEIQQLNENSRRSWMIFAVSSVPVAVIAFLWLQKTELTYVWLHLAALAVLVSNINAAVIREASINNKATIDVMVQTIHKLEEGHIFADNIPMLSSSELGFLSQDLNSLRRRLYHIVTTIFHTVEMIVNGSNQVFESASNVAEMANWQASNIEEIASSLQDIAAKIHATSKNAQKNLKIVSEISDFSEDGKSILDTALLEMNQVFEKMDMIKNFSSRTSILSINASIEASHTGGENGKSFSVVASEIRKLAESSKLAGKSISESIQNSSEATQKVGGFFESMFPKIHENESLFKKIADSAEEQKQDIQSIHEGIKLLNRIAQNNASSAEELSATAQDMEQQAQDLLKEILFFKIDGSFDFLPIENN